MVWWIAALLVVEAARSTAPWPAQQTAVRSGSSRAAAVLDSPDLGYLLLLLLVTAAILDAVLLRRELLEAPESVAGGRRTSARRQRVLLRKKGHSSHSGWTTRAPWLLVRLPRLEGKV